MSDRSGSAPGSLVRTPEFTRALDLLHSRSNLFLTGNAGTGKSTLVRTFIAETERRVVVAAPTGIAALNVEGYTIHRLFGFTPRTTVEEVAVGDYRPTRFAATLRSLETLIIDEASMVRADLFDKIALALGRFGPHPGTPFGGVQIVLVGDLLQLPPVVQGEEADFFTTRYPTPYFFSADHFHRDEFPTVSLTTVFRQLGDQRLTEILNAIREGVLLDHARAELNSRTDPGFVPDEDEFWLTLAPTNRIVTARNRERLDRLPGEQFVHQGIEYGDLGLFEPPAERTLQFKVGAQIMMKSNDPANRWVNGTLGRVVGVASPADTSGPSPRETEVEVAVQFRDGSTAVVTPHTWEATRPVVTGGSLNHEVIGSFTQLPFTLAWAITIHKSQGQTLDNLIVDLSGGAFDFGQVYVALSRCTSLSGLVLKRDVLTKDLKTDRRVMRFLRAATDPTGDHRFCALGMLTVGEEGRMSRPRPVEIAVAFADGTALSTLINPTRDLADARTRFNITVDDVLLAPTLPEAWSVLGPLLEGWTPVGWGTDQALGLVDFELKRLGMTVPLPLGVEVPPTDLTAVEVAGLRAPTALARAQAALSAHQRLDVRDPSAGVFDSYSGTDAGTAYLLTRDAEAITPTSPLLPHLSELLDLSQGLGEVLLHGHCAETARSRHPKLAQGTSPTLRALLARQLESAVARSARLPASVLSGLAHADDLLGSQVSAVAEAAHAAQDLTVLLVSGTRVCFTGTAQSTEGRIIERETLHEWAASRGLIPVATVTKTRCEVLVTAEVGTQSGKAKKAVDYGKTVIGVEEFLTWFDAAEPTSR